MTAIDLQLAEDRALRDAARRLFDADVAFIREDLAQRGPGRRIADRTIDAALDTADDGLNLAADHKALVAVITTAIFAWFARGPICRTFVAVRDVAQDKLR